MNVRYLSIAEEELAQAIEYYESKETGLGLRFYTEYRSALKRVLVYPEAWFPLSENTRRWCGGTRCRPPPTRDDNRCLG